MQSSTRRILSILAWRGERAARAGAYGLALGATALSGLLRWFLPEALSKAPYLGFYPAVVVSAALGGVGPGLVATFASLLAVILVFGRFDIHDHGATLRHVIWVVGGIGVSLLSGRLNTGRTRAQQDAAAARAAEDALRRQMTQREQAEAALRESEAKYRELNAELEQRIAERTAEVEKERRRFFDVLEALPAMICLLTPDYHVAFANRSFRERFGDSNGRRCYEYCFAKT